MTDPPPPRRMGTVTRTTPAEGTAMNRQSERTNVIVATAGLAAVLLVAPLSTLMTVAVVATMLGIALTYRLTASPVQVVRAEVPVHDRRRQAVSPHR